MARIWPKPQALPPLRRPGPRAARSDRRPGRRAELRRGGAHHAPRHERDGLLRHPRRRGHRQGRGRRAEPLTPRGVLRRDLNAARRASYRRRYRRHPSPSPRDPRAEARSLPPELPARHAPDASDGGAPVAGSPRLAVVAGPFPPGEYPVVVVGSGPGGLQTSYSLSRLGVEHALISRDPLPGGMFRFYPVFERLLSWTQYDAPFERGTRPYEWYDHNSLVGDVPEHQAICADVMDRTHVVPSRPEMEQGLAAFVDRTDVRVRYQCEWQSTRRDDDGSLVLTTTDGEYRCRAAVFALGVTDPWRSPIP